LVCLTRFQRATHSLKTAALKFNGAQEIFYLNLMDLEPFNDTYDYQCLLSRQIKMAYSITVSYSILEEIIFRLKPAKIDQVVLTVSGIQM